MPCSEAGSRAAKIHETRACARVTALWCRKRASPAVHPGRTSVLSIAR